MADTIVITNENGLGKLGDRLETVFEARSDQTLVTTYDNPDTAPELRTSYLIGPDEDRPYPVEFAKTIRRNGNIVAAHDFSGQNLIDEAIDFVEYLEENGHL